MSTPVISPLQRISHPLKEKEDRKDVQCAQLSLHTSVFHSLRAVFRGVLDLLVSAFDR